MATLWGAKSFFSRSANTDTQIGSQPIPIQTPTPTPVPSPTPKQQLIRSERSFEVLNGSGVIGAAKKLADKLRELGYQVIKVGNADRDDYPKNLILVGKDQREKVDVLIADLRDVIKIASVGGELTDSTASARIIIGKE